MIKRYALYAVMALISLAMLLFVAGFLLSHTPLAFLVGLCYALAIKLLGLGFALLAVAAVLALAQAVGRDLRRFFSREARALRKMLALRSRREQLVNLTLAKARQLRYRMQFKQQRLLAANDKKQLRQLFKAVQRELQTAKQRLSKTDYQALRRHLKATYRQADIDGLLAVRKQLTGLDA